MWEHSKGHRYKGYGNGKLYKEIRLRVPLDDTEMDRLYAYAALEHIAMSSLACRFLRAGLKKLDKEYRRRGITV